MKTCSPFESDVSDTASEVSLTAKYDETVVQQFVDNEVSTAKINYAVYNDLISNPITQELNVRYYTKLVLSAMDKPDLKNGVRLAKEYAEMRQVHQLAIEYDSP